MALVSVHPRGKVLKGFTALGPYIREGQCSETIFLRLSRCMHQHADCA